VRVKQLQAPADERGMGATPRFTTARSASHGQRQTAERLLIGACAVADALIRDGKGYGRDPDQDCKFVDENGRVLSGQ
jgi:hypothetical protein